MIRLFKIKLSAYALVYALLILILLAGFSSTYIQLNYLSRHRQAMLLVRQDLAHHSKQALLQIKAADPEATSGQWDYKAYPLAQFSYQKAYWGMFEKLTVQGQQHQFIERFQVLIGHQVNHPQAPSLYHQSHDPLKICGDTRVKGLAYIPHKGVERAYIAGKAASSTQLIDGKTQRLKRNQTAQFSSLEAFRLDLPTWETYSQQAVAIDPERSYKQPFDLEPLVLDASELDRLDNTYRGQVIIISQHPLRIAAEANLQQCLVIAPSLVFESGFKGQVQAFASVGIQVEEHVHLQYPSALGLQAQGDSTALILETDVRLEGVLMARSTQASSKFQSQVECRAGSLIKGQVFCKDVNTQLSGRIFGSVYVNRLFLKTPSSIYTNHLLDTEIDLSQLDERFSGIQGLYPSTKTIIKWLEHTPFSRPN